MRRIAKCVWGMRWVRIGAGSVLVFCGFALGFVPFLPGLLFGVSGLAILAREFPRLKKYVAPLERVFARFKHFRKKR